MSEALQRRPELRPLSREHHHALVLSHQLKHGLAGQSVAGAPTDLEGLTALAQDAYDRHLKRHFRAEEDLVLPTFLGHVTVEHPLVVRFLEDHAILHRDLHDSVDVERSEADRRASLGEFARRLEAHVRFEERELFTLLQATLTEDELVDLGADLARALPEAAVPS